MVELMKARQSSKAATTSTVNGAVSAFDPATDPPTTKKVRQSLKLNTAKPGGSSFLTHSTSVNVMMTSKHLMQKKKGNELLEILEEPQETKKVPGTL